MSGEDLYAEPTPTQPAKRSKKKPKYEQVEGEMLLSNGWVAVAPSLLYFK